MRGTSRPLRPASSRSPRPASQATVESSSSRLPGFTSAVRPPPRLSERSATLESSQPPLATSATRCAPPVTLRSAIIATGSDAVSAFPAGTSRTPSPSPRQSSASQRSPDGCTSTTVVCVTPAGTVSATLIRIGWLSRMARPRSRSLSGDAAGTRSISCHGCTSGVPSALATSSSTTLPASGSRPNGARICCQGSGWPSTDSMLRPAVSSTGSPSATSAATSSARSFSSRERSSCARRSAGIATKTCGLPCGFAGRSPRPGVHSRMPKPALRSASAAAARSLWSWRGRSSESRSLCTNTTSGIEPDAMLRMAPESTSSPRKPQL